MNEFIQTYGMEILSTIILAVASYLGVIIKNLYKKYVDNETKERVAKTVVKAVEQLYTDLHGEDKYNKAVENVSAMLSERGIANCTELEIKMLIESAVKELNISFSGEVK